MEHASHDSYCDRSVSPEVIEYIEAHLDSTPLQIYQDIVSHAELGREAKELTQKQVWYWWRERSASIWHLDDYPFQSIAASLGPGMMLPAGADAIAGAELLQRVVDQYGHDIRRTGNSARTSSQLIGQTIIKEGQVRGFALYAAGVIAALRERTVEVSLDATYGTNNSGHDLFAVLGELDGTGAPLMYLLLDTKDLLGDGRRIEMLAEALGMLKGMGIVPSFVGCDKNSAEINAIGQVWPDAKIQLCYWHVRRALRQRFSNGKATSTNTYEPFEAAQTVQDLEMCWGISE